MNNKGLYIFIGMGFELGIVVIGALYVGGMLDDHYKTKGVFAASLMMVCFFSWVFHFIVLLRKFQKELDEEEQNTTQNPPGPMQ